MAAEMNKRRVEILLNSIAGGDTDLEACQAAGIRTSDLRTWRKDKAFEAQYQAAYEDGSDVLEAEAFRRAVRGVSKGVYFQGIKVNEEYQYSDTLLIKLLQARRPDKYKDRVQNDIGGVGGNPIQVEGIRRIIVDPKKPKR